MKLSVRALFGVLLLVGVVASAQAQLYGLSRAGEVFEIDINTGAGTLVYNLPNPDPCGGGGTSTEIEYDPASGTAFAQVPDGGFCGYQFDIATGAAASAGLGNAGSHTGLEIVGGVWYATVIFGGGGGSPSNLQILDPATGMSTLVGATGVNAISGLAYNGATLFGIAGGPGPANLYTINTATGVATLVGATTIQAGSLEFGPDGRLYAGGTNTNLGEIHIIDPATGASTLLGATGFGAVTGLALIAPLGPPPPPAIIPVMSPIGLTVLALLLGLVAIRRIKTVPVR